KKKRNPELVEMHKLIEAMPEFSGSEIEQVVVSALYEGFETDSSKYELSTEQLVASAREIVPLSVTMHEGIAAMREWAKSRARMASVHQLSAAQQLAIQIDRKLEV